MPNEPVNTELSDELLSALADGELDPGEADQACALWRGAEHAKSKWNDYHLIGDVLRSEELARGRAHDRAFLARVQAELARQPVVLAPEAARPEVPELQPQVVALAAGGGKKAARWAWRGPSAVAAGVVMVAGAWTLTRTSLDEGSGTLAAGAPQSSQIVAVSASSPVALAAPASPEALPANGALVRDAELDRYLAAHRQFSSASVLGAQQGALRQVVVSTEAAGR